MWDFILPKFTFSELFVSLRFVSSFQRVFHFKLDRYSAELCSGWNAAFCEVVVQISYSSNIILTME